MGESNRLTEEQQKTLAEDSLKQCPRFHECSVSICPLDFEIHKRVYVRGLDEICGLSKKRRLELGIYLPWKGMTRKEWGYYCQYHPDEKVPYPKFRVMPM